MKKSFKTGLGFGVTSAVLTTLGLVVGVAVGTVSKTAVEVSIITIAIVDAFSDSLGIHIAQDATGKRERSVWESTISTFISKFFIAFSFLVPFIFLDLSIALIICIIWGALLIGVLNYFLAKDNGENTFKAVVEHVFLAGCVVFVTYIVGSFLRNY